MESIVIIAKGQSVLRCTKEFIDSHDEVAIVNFPPFKWYKDNISDHARIHFCNTYILDAVNWGTEEIETYYAKNKLGIKYVYNIGGHYKNDHLKHYKDKKIIFDFHFRRKMCNYDKTRKFFDWYPPAGILAVEHILSNFPNLKSLSLIGYDFYNGADRLDPSKFNECYYYYDNKEAWNNRAPQYTLTTYKHITELPTINGHNPQRQIDYLINKIKNNPQIKFTIYTSYKFPKFNNLIIK